MILPTIDLEKELLGQGYLYVGGLDEVGRGPLAGPVVSAVVVANLEDIVEGVRDSKKLSEKKREDIFPLLIEKSQGYGIGIVDNHTIDEIGIRPAVKLSMELAVKELIEKFSISPSYLIADGGISLLDDYEMRSIVKGDMYHYSISAASIIAKVTRDRIMKEYSLKYPEYGFNTHVGYGTKKHIDAIRKFGVLDIHRKSFAPICNMVV